MDRRTGMGPGAVWKTDGPLRGMEFNSPTVRWRSGQLLALNSELVDLFGSSSTSLGHARTD